METIEEKKAAAAKAEGDFAAAHFARFGVSRASIFALIDRYAALYETMGEVRLPAPGGGVVAAACRKGCWFCCHTIIVVTAPEAFYVADHIEATRDPAGLAATKAAVAAADARTRGRKGDERWGFGPPCPLLDAAEGACSVYKGRPLACRGAFSSSLDSCKTAFAERAVNPRSLGRAPFIFQNADVLIQALAAGLRSTGRTLVKLELNAALVAIWASDDAFERWLAGEDIFRDARAPGDGGALA